MGSAVQLEFTLKDAQMMAKLLALAQQQDKNTAAIGKTVKESQAWERENKRAVDEAKRGAEEMMRIREREISEEQRIHAERKRMYEDLFAARDKELKQAEEIATKQRLMQTIRPPHLRMGLHGDPMAPNVAALAAMRSTAAAAGEAGKNIERASRAGHHAFGGEAISQLKGYATGLLSIAAAAGEVKQRFVMMDEMRRKATASLEGSQDQNEQLAQLSGGDARKFKSLKWQRDALYQEFGISRDEAAGAIFAAESAGLTPKQRRLAGRAGQVGDAGEAARFMGTIKNVYKGEISPEAGLAIAFKAAADAPGMDFKHFAEHEPASFASGKELGLTMPQVTALIGKMSTQFGTPEEPFERFEVLAGRMSIDKKFRRRGLSGLGELVAKSDSEVDSVLGSTAGLRPEDAEQFLGKRKEMREAVRALRNVWPEIQPYADELARAGHKDLVGKAAAARFADPAERSQLRGRQASAVATVRREGSLGVRASELNAAYDLIEARDREMGYDEGDIAQRQRWAKFFGGITGTKGGAYFGAGTAHFSTMHEAFGEPQWARDMLATMKEIADTNRQMANQAPARQPPPNPNGGGRR